MAQSEVDAQTYTKIGLVEYWKGQFCGPIAALMLSCTQM